MKLFELFRRMTDIINERDHIIELIEDMMTNKDYDKIERAAQIFATFKYRDDREGWKQGIPFSTNGEELNTVLQQVTHQGDDMATKRLLRKILELTDG